LIPMPKKQKPLFSVRVRVPATSANLGPGFDALGLALTLYNEVHLTGWAAPGFPPLTVSVQGEGAGRIPLDRTNLVVRCVERVFSRHKKKLPSLVLRLVNRIPLARGLGSSSAAIAGGIAAANRALGGPMALEEMVFLASQIEGHPDNVTPALAGGFCVAVVSGDKVTYAGWNDPALFKGLKAVAAVPDFELSTARARRVLPARVPLGDAVFNVARSSLLVGALASRRWGLLAQAMDDRLHQPYRKNLVPGLDEALAAARRAGALGACLSGAGPTVLALAEFSRAGKVGESMQRAFSRRDVRAGIKIMDVDREGVQ
jgi:homoserine kinase